MQLDQRQQDSRINTIYIIIIKKYNGCFKRLSYKNKNATIVNIIELEMVAHDVASYDLEQITDDE